MIKRNPGRLGRQDMILVAALMLVAVAQSWVEPRTSYAMDVQVDGLQLPAEQRDPALVAVIPGGGEFKAIAAPES